MPFLADRNFKGPSHILRHVRYRLKRDTGVLERGLGSVGGQYALMLPQEKTDLSFAEFGGSRRPYTAVAKSESDPNKNTPGLSDRGHSQIMERETGIASAVRLCRTAR